MVTKEVRVVIEMDDDRKWKWEVYSDGWSHMGGDGDGVEDKDGKAWLYRSVERELDDAIYEADEMLSEN